MLNLLGMMVSVFTLQAFVLRSALRATRDDGLQNPLPLFSSELIVLVGVYLTLVLALLFGPAYAALAATGRAFRDSVAELERQHAAENAWKVWHDTRRTLDEALLLRVSVQESFTAGAAVLAPFLTSLLALLTRER